MGGNRPQGALELEIIMQSKPPPKKTGVHESFRLPVAPRGRLLARDWSGK